MPVNRICLKQGADRRARSGHPWIFSNEIGKISDNIQAGESCEVLSSSGQFIGIGYFNPHSLISVRMLSKEREDIDSPEFFISRLQSAIAYRQSLYPQADALRLIHGEGDDLPGFVVDCYGSVLSVQLLSQGAETRREALVEALVRLFGPTAIVARNDAGVRELEGLPRQVELLYGELPEQVNVSENDLLFTVDIMEGQKTGSFLDQKENHQAHQGKVSGKRVLDLFCYSGSWSIHAAHYGASEVTGVDISAGAVALARKNAALNGYDQLCTFVKADVFELLKDYERRNERFGVVVLDPPAFVKSKKKLAEAVRGYLTINRRAMELVEPGGYLFTCSCSYHMERELFLDTLRKAGAQAGRKVRLVEMRGQSFDHPVLLSCPETDYLKCAILQIL